MRRLVLTLAWATALALGATQAAAVVRSQAVADSSASEDAVAISFATANGAAQHLPYFDVRGAYPGMQRQRRVVRISNTSATPVSYDLSVAVPPAAGGLSLAGVLVVTIMSGDNKTVLYKGALADVQVPGGAIAAGAQVAHLMTIQWPDGGADDNRYQGLRTRFDLRARARATA